jgi:hypothetical protein
MKVRTIVAAVAAVVATGTASAATIGSAGNNHSFADAMLVPDGYFTTIINGAIELSDTLPNASVVAFSSGPFDYYKFTTAAVGNIILDIDYTYTFSGNPGSFDPEIALWKADGTLLGQNDDRGTIDIGSAHEWDSYLNLSNLQAGTYVVGVARYSALADDGGWNATYSEIIPNNSFYTLHISAPVPEPESYAMLLAGLGLMGLIARRRRQD